MKSRSRAKLTPTWRRGPAGYSRKETTLPPQLRAFCHPWRRARRPNPGLGRKCSWRPVLHPPDRSEQQDSPLQIPCGSRPRLSNTLLCGGQKGQRRTERGKGMRRRRRRDHPEWFRVHSRDRGELAVNGTEASGPLCDRTCACSVGFKLGHKIVSRWVLMDQCGCHLLPPMLVLCRVSFVATCGLVVPPLTVRSKRESPFQPFRVLRWCEQPSPCTLPTSG